MFNLAPAQVVGRRKLRQKLRTQNSQGSHNYFAYLYVVKQQVSFEMYFG